MTENAVNLREVECFVAAVRCGSFSAAAKSLGLSQPSLWSHISRLERDASLQLFRRHSRGIVPTAAASELFPLAIEILDAVGRFRKAAVALDSTGHPNEFHLGVTPTPSRLLLPTIMAHCRKHGRRVHVTLARSNQLLEMVANEEMDAAICYDPKPDSRVTRTDLYRDPNHLIGPPDLVDSSLGPVLFDDLVKFPLVMETDSLAARVAKKRHVPLNILDEIDVFNVRRDMILSYRRCSIMSFALFEEEVREQKVGTRRVTSPQLNPTATLLTQAGSTSDVEAFILSGISPLIVRTIADGRIGWHSPGRRRATTRRTNQAKQKR